MSDTTEFHDANRIGTDNSTHVIIPCSDILSHKYRVVDRRRLLHINGVTAYELTVECQTKECSRKSNLILSSGEFPESPSEVDDLMYDVYRWFHDEAANLLSFQNDESVYLATYALIAGEEGSRSLLRSRLALFTAADMGYHDGHQNRELKQKEKLLRTAKQQTRSSLQRLEGEQDPILRRFY